MVIVGFNVVDCIAVEWTRNAISQNIMNRLGVERLLNFSVWGGEEMYQDEDRYGQR